MDSTLLKQMFTNGYSELQVLSGGTTDAENYRFNAGNKSWLLRQFNPEHTLQERQQEAIISQLAGEYGISSKVFYADENNLIREFIVGEVLHYADLHNKQNLATIVNLLKQQHQIPLKNIHPAATCQQRIKQFLQKINLPHLLQQLEIDFDFECDEFTPVLIHNDLHHANILINDSQIKFIDWSLAGAGNCFSDLAEIAIYLTEDLQRYLLECYFGDDNNYPQLQHACYAHLLLYGCWALSMANTEIDTSMLQQSQRNFNTWITDILQQNLKLATAEDFIDFAASCFIEFKNLRI